MTSAETTQPEPQAVSLTILAVRCAGCGHTRSVHSFGQRCLAGDCACRSHVGP